MSWKQNVTTAQRAFVVRPHWQPILSRPPPRSAWMGRTLTTRWIQGGQVAMTERFCMRLKIHMSWKQNVTTAQRAFVVRPHWQPILSRPPPRSAWMGRTLTTRWIQGGQVAMTERFCMRLKLKRVHYLLRKKKQ
ncbi:hypothetical protein BCR41DRAFT_388666 [Lobosporangium transversale]|uniref:Uncharacterized protein n=1 Tax=Lobosporangium transversale TaxID=64571 RepID=A0A1Y2GE24_9FUNG|nr:hypothetical protein BCR41DRAFT_388666 [Lobosporangium transversale]ORZ08262.1 hypothetical protein BCR41DRAFT_388666 [Lobosporangium transversale]|eukprot:XP_021878345.1 hypothetical protein BCR41DRAFT_388666 [Lobosporangium transversale]